MSSRDNFLPHNFDYVAVGIKVDLFEKLKQNVGFEYSSILKSGRIHKRACEEICKMSLYPYPINQFEDMAQDLYGENASLRTYIVQSASLRKNHLL